MRVYFLSVRPCALKINGEYLGETDGFERYVDLFPRERPFVEWIPCGNALPLSFFLTEDILFAPPHGVTLYRARNFLVLYARSFRFYAPLTLLAATPSVTVFSQGIPQMLCKNEVLLLGERFSACTATEYDDGDVILLQGEGALCALFRGTVVFNGETTQWQFAPEKRELTVTFPLHDFGSGTATHVWRLAGAMPSLLRSESSKRSESERSAPILCRFLQDLILERENEFLSPALASALPKIKDYLGEYSAVFPAREENAALIACPSGERIFTLKYFSCAVTDGKITNLSREW